MKGFGGVIAFIVGWVLSHLIKTVVEWAQTGKISHKKIIELLVKNRSGGMPSGHMTSFGALTTYIGLSEGFDSSIFALSLATAIIIAYDATNVRRSVGEIGAILKKEAKLKRVVRGHTIPEILAGTLLGVAIGTITHLILASLS